MAQKAEPVVPYATPEPVTTSPADADALKVVTVCNDVYAGLVLFAGVVATAAVGAGLKGPAWMIGYGLVLAVACAALHARRARWLALTVSAVNCLGFPLGTIVGIATIAVLARPGVARLFDRRPVRVIPLASSTATPAPPPSAA